MTAARSWPVRSGHGQGRAFPEVQGNAVSAPGVRMVEAPEAPTRSAVHIRIPSGRRERRRWRVALGDIHPSGDTPSLHAPWLMARTFTHAVIGRTRTGEDVADCTTASLVSRAGPDGEDRAAVGGIRSLLVTQHFGRTLCDRNNQVVLRLRTGCAGERQCRAAPGGRRRTLTSASWDFRGTDRRGTLLAGRSGRGWPAGSRRPGPPDCNAAA